MARPYKLCCGENVHTAVLTEQQVRETRTRYATENVTQYALAAEYGVAQTTISAIIRRANLKEVDGEEINNECTKSSIVAGVSTRI
jgi:hypothetical protein